ncbi:MAG TPA: hypothetical protein VLU24_12285, partial [Mycobacterium sp.]|nr:hypothetical protein [Mycobacterium sp.]
MSDGAGAGVVPGDGGVVVSVGEVVVGAGVASGLLPDVVGAGGAAGVGDLHTGNSDCSTNLRICSAASSRLPPGRPA